MKNLLSKVFSVLTAFMMVIGFGMTVHAEGNSGTITIDPANPGQTYSIYRILDETYNATTGTTAYTVNSSWKDFSETTAFTTYFDKVEGTDNVIPKSTFDEENSNAAKTFAKSALAYAMAEDTKIEAVDTKTAGTDKTTLNFGNLPYGYYLVKSTTGALLSLKSTAPDGIIEDKNQVPGFEKKETTNTEKGVGDVVNYQITIDQTAGAEKVVVHDTMTAGLTFNNDIVVKFGETVGTLVTDYTVVTTVDDETKETTFELTLTASGLNKLAQGACVITYTATINDDALTTNSLTNTATLEYGNNSEAAVRPVSINKPISFDLNKYAKKADDSEVNLAGAEFTLTRTDGQDVTEKNVVVKFTKDGNTYTKSTAEGASSTITSVNGNVVLQGLAAGTYSLEETKAPDGYNKLTAPITFNVDEYGVISGVTSEYASFVKNEEINQYTLKVLNTTNAQLPSTGGRGTTMLYAAGGVLVLGAAVMLITKKRMQA